MSVDTPRPGSGLVRNETDRQVVLALLEGRSTRAGIAAATGLSKPTTSQSILRLAQAGLVREAGRQQGGRGRTGVLYELAGETGLALVLDAAPGRLVAECVDAAGGVRHRTEQACGATISARDLLDRLARLVQVTQEAVGELPLRVLGVADPVDTRARRLVHLTGSPFVLGDAELSGVLGEHGVVDNDVAWAALAELRAPVGETDNASFVYVHLGVGLGAAVVDGGRVIAGDRGLAGEIAHLLTVGADGRAARLLDALEALGLMTPGTTSLDGGRVRAALAGPTRAAVVAALAGALSSCVALLEPETVLLGGPWADAPGLVDDVDAALSPGARFAAPHPVRVRLAQVPDAPLAGARSRAVELARERLLSAV